MTDLREQETEYAESLALGAEEATGANRRSFLGSFNKMPPWVGAVIGIVVILLVWEFVAVTFF